MLPNGITPKIKALTGGFTRRKTEKQAEEKSMYKMNYEAPTVEITRFAAVDILTASTDPFDGEWVPIGGSGRSSSESFKVF